MVDSEYALKWFATNRSTSDDLPTPASPSSTSLTSLTFPPIPPAAAMLAASRGGAFLASASKAGDRATLAVHSRGLSGSAAARSLARLPRVFWQAALKLCPRKARLRRSDKMD
jgi:hypothetical protein